MDRARIAYASKAFENSDFDLAQSVLVGDKLQSHQLYKRILAAQEKRRKNRRAVRSLRLIALCLNWSRADYADHFHGYDLAGQRPSRTGRKGQKRLPTALYW